jgi:hypothetical protein
VIFVGFMVLSDEWWVLPPYNEFRWYTDISAFLADFNQLRYFFESQLMSGKLPDIGVFQQGSQENEVIWAERPFRTRKIYPGNSVVVSLDFETAKLYVGFSDLYLLNDQFPKKHRGKFKKWILSNGNFVQNAKGEPYEKGNTLLRFIAVLSSDDVSFYKRKLSEE